MIDLAALGKLGAAGHRHVPRAVVIAGVFWFCGETFASLTPLLHRCGGLVTTPDGRSHVAGCGTSVVGPRLYHGLVALPIFVCVSVLISRLAETTRDFMAGVSWPEAGWQALLLKPVRHLMTARQVSRVTRWKNVVACGLPEGTGSRHLARRAVARQQQDKSERMLREFPQDHELLGPTAIGSRSTATAEWAEREYGLDLADCLETLVGRLPEGQRDTHDSLRRNGRGFERFVWAWCSAY
jgi:hypothetical protein